MPVLYRRFLGYFQVVFVFIIFSACSRNRSDSDDLKIFKYNESSGVVTLDPAFAKDLPHIWSCNQLYNGLVSLDEKLNIVPSIARSWQISDSGKLYTFQLRNDVYFHDNEIFKGVKRIVVASDFVFSFQRILDPSIASPGSWIFNYVENINGKPAFVAVNNSVFQIRLKNAFPAFLGILSMTYTSVVPKEAVEFYGTDFRKNPVGTGPFYFKYWKEGVKLVLLKNENYFEKFGDDRLPYIQGVAVSFLVDKQTAFLEFIKGKLDFMSGIDARYKDELLTRDGKLRSKYRDKIYLESQPYLNTEYIGIYIDTLPGKRNQMRNLALRKAINYAIDREKMIKFLRNGIGKPGSGGMIPFGMPGYDVTGNIGYTYQPVIASEIIKKQQLSETIITLTTIAEYVDLAKFIQSQLNAIGLKVLVEVSPPIAMRQARALGKLEFFRSSWVADYPDAENYLAMFYSKNFTPNGPNFTHYKNTTFDDLYERASKIDNLMSRQMLYHQMDSIMMEESPVVILFYDEVLRFVNSRISGFESNPINILDLRKVKIKTEN